MSRCATLLYMCLCPVRDIICRCYSLHLAAMNMRFMRPML